ncbi:Peptidylarginine deiminase precursor [Novipirellula galeiformis]|uniref:Peptidylarginine deiminase n=1 Tax=Novipirellula galeiformis TaxID=2528004 RepID=A0A5C6BFI9_9BACT|nr:agmatine deiminase family protein [Novipirellula galeiformis]TWU10049.1 Peptidylarginine deiminase precursor [Novipirellula galeiformis]
MVTAFFLRSRFSLQLGFAIGFAVTATTGFAQTYASPSFVRGLPTWSNDAAVTLRPDHGQTRAPDPALIERLAVEAGKANLNRPYPRLPGEFESQRALMFSVSDWQAHDAVILQQIVQKTAGHIPLLILCNNPQQLVDAVDWIARGRVPTHHVYFCEIDLDTIWMRDFGPLLAESQRGTDVIDFFYEGTRPKDDALPIVWAKRTGAKLVSVPWTMQGGNLLSNGRRLALTTHRIFEDNRISFPKPWPGLEPEVERHKMVIEAFTQHCNLAELVVLEPLQHEETGHVDMFATFLRADQVVVARVDPRSDPVNAAILDRNAARLQRVVVDGNPMQVIRIDIPPRQGTSWSAYTNVILANNLVLIPIFDSDPAELVARAMEIYGRLLPNHAIKTVDMTGLKEMQGELHCLSMNLPAFAPLPDKVIDFAKAEDYRRRFNAIEPQ